jgi:uncharacterized protein (DUF433 family)
MAQNGRSVQRSFRLSRRTAELLDAEAERTPESRNALADRLLGEALRRERYPYVAFRWGAARWRRAYLVGTRLHIYQVISTYRGEGNDVEATAEYFGIPLYLAQAAVAYYADFADEVDAAWAEAERREKTEYTRWERQQRASA